MLFQVTFVIIAGEESILVANVFGAFDPVTGDPMVPGLTAVSDLIIVDADGTELQRHGLDEIVELKKYEAKTVLPSTGKWHRVEISHFS